MDPYILVTFVCALGLALIHILAGKMHFLGSVPRSKWLSLAGGISVAYVFVHIFPELPEWQEQLSENIPALYRSTEHHVYLIALLGFSVYYVLERLVRATGSHKSSASSTEEHNPGIFWLHITSFAFYNVLTGYLLVNREEKDIKNLLFFFFALLLHFLVNDFGLHQHHKQVYGQKGRWVLSIAVMAGWLAGTFVILQPAVISTCFSFLAGGIVLNVMKEELPEDRNSSSLSFIIGAGLYTALLLLL